MKLFPISFLSSIKGSGLRNRLALFAVILSVIPVLVLGGVSLYLIDLAHKQDVSRMELQLIDLKIREIQKFFSDTLGILELRVGFTQKAEIELSGQEFLLAGLLEENNAFEEVSFIGLEGRESAKKIRNQEEPSFFDVSGLQKFKEAVQGKNFIGDVYYTLSGPLITLAAPVKNKNGDMIQILSAEVNLSQIARSIEASLLGATGYLIVTDQRGFLIARGGAHDVEAGIDLSGFERVKKVLTGETLDALGSRDKYKSLFGTSDVVGAGKKIPRIGWAILAEWPLDDADALVRDIRNQVALFVLFGIFAVLLIAPLFAERLVRPIRALEKGVAEIEKGNFEKEVKITTRDELEDLGNAFNKMAKGLKKLKELQDEFVFIAAHDLKAPVVAINGYISMLLEAEGGKLTDLGKDYIKQVKRGSDRLMRLVGDLLQVARSEAGRISIEVAEINIAEPIRETLAELKSSADEKSITLAYEAYPKMEHVLADSDRVKELLANFVSNAIKYTPVKGEVKVFHEVKEGMLITHVQDNGFGISKEAQKKLFEKFYRVKTKETSSIEGTGLGLFIVKHLAEKMNGQVWFVSEEGKGSTFSFSLPLAILKG